MTVSVTEEEEQKIWSFVLYFLGRRGLHDCSKQVSLNRITIFRHAVSTAPLATWVRIGHQRSRCHFSEKTTEIFQNISQLDYLWIFFCFEPPDFDLGHLNFCQSLARMGHQFSKLNGIPDIAYYYNTICDQVPVLFRFLQTNKLRATLQAMPLSFQTQRSLSSRPFLKNTKSMETWFCYERLLE